MLIGRVFGFVSTGFSSMFFGSITAFFSTAAISFPLIASSILCWLEFVTKLSAGIFVSSFFVCFLLLEDVFASGIMGGAKLDVVEGATVFMLLLSGCIIVVLD